MAESTNFVLALIAAIIAAISCRAIESNETPVRSEVELFGNRPVVVKFTCPAIYGRYPHPLSCEYFFECRFGYPTLMHCNRGYLYDESREQCIDKRKVHCRIGDNKDKIPEKKEEIKYFKCPYIWGTFAHPNDCSKYFVCLYNIPTLFQCPGSDLFHDKARKCLHRKRVDCGRRLDRDGMKTSKKPQKSTTMTVVTTTTTIPTTTEGHKKFFCPFPSGRYADPEDCSQYYECNSFRASLHQCPRSKLYDERQEECREEQLVKCGDRHGGIGDQEDKNGNVHCPYNWGSFAHPNDCSKYIVCIYNFPTIFTCRKNELFHAYIRKCLPKNKVSCNNRINPDDLFPLGKSTSISTLPTTTKKIPVTTVSITPELVTTTTTEPTTTTTPEPTTTTTPEPTTTTPEPTTTTPEPTTTTTPEPTTTSTPEPTTTTTPEPTTTTTPEPTTTTTPEPTTTTTPEPTTTTTPEPTTTTTPEPTTITTPEPTTTTPEPTTTTTLETTIFTQFPVTKPNTPPPTNCEDDDLDCIVDETGDVLGWFDCPKRYGHFPHGSSKQLFIHCDNFRPFIKKCADQTEFSPEYHVCTWVDKTKGV